MNFNFVLSMHFIAFMTTNAWDLFFQTLGMNINNFMKF